jgi:pyroglutamyl-peptidase
MKILITAFGPFDKFTVNPSEIVLNMLKESINIHQYLEFEWQVLNVSYKEIDYFIKNKKSHHDLIIHLGVATNSKQMRFEKKAKNLKSGKDIYNVNPSNEAISGNIDFISSSFPINILNNIISNISTHVVFSNDAGTYLCNYLYFNSLHYFSDKTHVLFVHIADVYSEPEAVSIENQVTILVTLLDNYYNLIKRDLSN